MPQTKTVNNQLIIPMRVSNWCLYITVVSIQRSELQITVYIWNELTSTSRTQYALHT